MVTDDTYRNDENKFAPLIRKIIIQNLYLFPDNLTRIKQSTDHEDSKMSFDLVFMSKINISVRIREHSFLKYSDFTLRLKNCGSGKSEIAKLEEGFGQIYFYAWLSSDGQSIEKWMLIDIDPIRNKLDNGTYRKNPDNSTFRYYSIQWLKDNNSLIKGGFRPI